MTQDEKYMKAAIQQVVKGGIGIRGKIIGKLLYGDLGGIRLADYVFFSNYRSLQNGKFHTSSGLYQDKDTIFQPFPATPADFFCIRIRLQ